MSKLVIGLVGGIGSGKSRVAAAFAARGGYVIDADKAGHEALHDPDIRKRIIDRWGPELLDENGEIVRKRLGQIVFADDGERRALETIVHPWIGRRLREEVVKAKNDPSVPFVILDAAVMFETGWNSACNQLVYVDVPRPIRLERIASQRGWTREQVEARERAQLCLSTKAARSDHVLDNSGSVEKLQQQVDDLLKDWNLLKDEVER